MRGAPAETNVFHVAPDEDSPGRLLLSDTSQPSSYPSDCAVPWDYFAFVSCPIPSGGIRVEGGDRDDQLNVDDDLPGGLAVTLDGGGGNDVLRGPAFTANADTLVGGDGTTRSPAASPPTRSTAASATTRSTPRRPRRHPPPARATTSSSPTTGTSRAPT